MNTKRLMRLLIVLFLLTALPGLTVALAQGPGGTAAPEAYSAYESEPNNAFGTADMIQVGDVVSARFNERNDHDFFVFSAPGDGFILAEAGYVGTNAIPKMKLYDRTGTLMTYEYESENIPLLFWRVKVADSPYYIEVEDWYGDGGGSDYDYKVMLSSPLLISAAPTNLGTGMVAGIPFQAADILAWSELNTGEERWVMLFDASDVGITKNIASIGLPTDGWTGDTLIMSFSANTAIPDLNQTATPYQLVGFDFDLNQVGQYTEGQFIGKFGFTGLSTSAEKIDAWDSGGGAGCFGDAVSTVGAAAVTTWWGSVMKQPDENVFCWRWDHQGWDYFFNGKSVSGLAIEDVNAMAWDGSHGRLLLNILGNGSVMGHAVTQKDIFAINYPGYTWGGVAWHGPDHGWNYNIDAIEWTGW